VIHLAGESIAGIWSAAKKRRIRDSRVRGTELLARSLAMCSPPPSCLVSASGVSFYGDSGNREVDEGDPIGQGFLADVCRDWEGSLAPARQAGIRVIMARMGIVLSAGGGALAQMLPPFRLGLGGIAGSGRQYLSWISLEDAARALIHLVECKAVHGPANIVSPNPVTNVEFTRALGRALRRPTILPVPSFALRCLPGGMAHETILASIRARPGVLQKNSFPFRHPSIGEGIRSALSK